MKIATFKSGLMVGTLTIVAGRGYLSYRHYNLIEIDLENELEKEQSQEIIKEAGKYCIKNNAQLWAY